MHIISRSKKSGATPIPKACSCKPSQAQLMHNQACDPQLAHAQQLFQARVPWSQGQRFAVDAAVDRTP
eukprot:1161393-Pelagomonas_calceolata.AAC.9